MKARFAGATHDLPQMETVVVTRGDLANKQKELKDLFLELNGLNALLLPQREETKGLLKRA